MVKVESGKAQFSFFRPEARQVFIVGDFNGWKIGPTPMRRTSTGHWTLCLELPVGEHRFRYWADGRWYTDFAAFGVVPGPFSYDSVVRISRPLVVVKIARAAGTGTYAVVPPAEMPADEFAEQPEPNTSGIRRRGRFLPAERRSLQVQGA